ncbi:hypothetical protein GCM10008904_32930 [Paraclostridium ghonii]|uniref:Transcriptional regulator with XRE-family HTH domain n=1 Tax=Paraclostridium ghonii TaxID=29358 RepID=A0ABU0N4S3_9FIRM|nr:helix-turn-helix domain-containing protein [Paeniclostridium ghonii]MDQ0557979.1 transcriptional regulator with XRE-family HTH domain [Paeniclostridium ghonii]
MYISDQIKTRRKELGLTQQQVADKVFVTRQTISKWELGKSQPDLITLTLLSQVLDFPLISDEKKYCSGGFLVMNKKLLLKNLIFTVIFGAIFLPIRILYTLNQKYKNSKLLKFVVKPILFVLLAIYINSLNLNAFIFVLLIMLLVYYTLNIYYHSSD